MLASALCLVLILPSVSFAPATAAAGEWTGTIDGDFRGVDDGSFGDFRRHAEFTFTVKQDGAISGSGTGWEQKARYYDDGSLCGEGRADVTFRVSGSFDRTTGKAEIKLEEFTPPTYNDSCFNVVMHPFGSWRSFKIELKDGASLDSGAGTRRPGSDYPPPRGTDVLVMHGEGEVIGDKPPAECPALTITPTLPPASDPRNLAKPSDGVSYRLRVDWGGSLPVSVDFVVIGGDGQTIIPQFQFDPANMTTTPISVLMDVTTRHAATGSYPIGIGVQVRDPDSGQLCWAATAVALVVSEESRASVLSLIRQSGDVNIMPDAAEDGTGVVVETGNDGAATLTAPSSADNSTTVDVNSNTRFTFDQLAKMVEKARDQEFAYELGAREEDEQFAYELWESQEESLVNTLLGKVEKISNSIRDFVYSSALGRDAIIRSNDILTCLIAPADPQVADLCSQQSMIFIHKGELHVVDVSEKSRAIDKVNEPVLLTDNSLIIPTDTEYAVKVQQSRSSVVTTVTMLEGSAIVVDLVSEDVKLVNAGQQYSMSASDAGGAIQTKDDIQDMSQNPGWWKVRIGDYATARDIDTTDGAKPVGRTSAFSDDDIWVWIEFLDLPADEANKVEFKWYGPDGSLYDTGDYPVFAEPFTGYWDSYRAFDLMGAGSYDATEKTGRWKVDVYYDGDFVKEIPFYIAKNTLVKDQSVTYGVFAYVEADDAEIKNTLENSFVQSSVAGFAGAENIKESNDIEWIKTTILDASSEGLLQSTLKLRGKSPVSGETTSLNDALLRTFIPTIGIDENFAVDTGNDGSIASIPSQLTFDGFVNISKGSGESNIETFQFSATKRLAADDASSDITITNNYEKYTGILVSSIVSGELTDPSIGNVRFTLAIGAEQLDIPTTLTITSIASEIQQNQQASVTGAISPPVNEGQVVLTYTKNDSSDEPIKRTMAVTNGAFSDSYNMEKDGTYTVTAEYLGSGAFLSSTTDAKTLTVNPSGCLIATAAFGSELTPQVQFLRSFRDNHILSTAAGSSFMNAFNTWYYSFSPYVADYERGQPWLQQAVRAAIYPLLGILTISEKAYASIPGEYGAVAAGMVASSMIGAVYFWPAAVAVQRFNKHDRKVVSVLTIVLAGLAAGAVSISLLVADQAALTISTPLLVVTIVAISALFSARLIGHMINKIARKN